MGVSQLSAVKVQQAGATCLISPWRLRPITEPAIEPAAQASLTSPVLVFMGKARGSLWRLNVRGCYPPDEPPCFPSTSKACFSFLLPAAGSAAGWSPSISQAAGWSWTCTSLSPDASRDQSVKAKQGGSACTFGLSSAPAADAPLPLPGSAFSGAERPFCSALGGFPP